MTRKKISTLIGMVMRFEPGRIILVHYPFTDRSSTKLRPALVVSSDAFHTGEDFVVVPISSKLAEGDRFGFTIRHEATYFSQTRLRQTSSVKWTKPMTISDKIVMRKLGTIPPQVLKEIRSKLQSMFE